MATRISLDNLLRNSTGDPRADIALLSRFLGQYTLQEDGFQNFYLGGGNTSVHLGDRMFVKLSGYPLSTITSDGFGDVSVHKVIDGLKKLEELCMQVLESDYIRDFSPVMELDAKVTKLLNRANQGVGEPSVETGLHAQLAGTPERPRCNIHTHNTIVNALLCSNGAETGYNELFGDDPNVQFMDFVEPGAPLSVAFNRRMKEWRSKGLDPKVILMAQHGIVVTGYSMEEVVELHDKVAIRIKEYLEKHLPEHPFGVSDCNPYNQVARQNALLDVASCFPGRTVHTPDEENDLVLRMLLSKTTKTSESAYARIARGMPNPDAVVYGGVALMVVNRVKGDPTSNLRKRIEAAKERYVEDHKNIRLDGSPYLPRIVLIPGLCSFTIGEDSKKCHKAYAALLDTVYVMRGAEAFGGMKPLSPKHLFYITNWGAEKRRAQRV